MNFVCNLRLLVKILAVCMITGTFVSCQKASKPGEANIPKEIKAYIEQITADVPQEGKVDYTFNKIEENLFRVEVKLKITEDFKGKGWSLNLTPAFEQDFTWACHLTPTDKHIIADHVWRSPALIWTSKDKELMVVPDLALRNTDKNRWYLDMDVPKKTMSIGVSDYVVKEHVLFQKKEMILKKGISQLAFYLIFNEGVDKLDNPFKTAHDFLWKQYGEESYVAQCKSKTNLDVYCKYAYDWAFKNWPRVYQEFELNGKTVGAPQFIINYTGSPNYKGEYNVREVPSIWNQAWFCSLRSAVGLYKYAKRTQNASLLDKANKAKELALQFPQDKGLFPAVIACDVKSVNTDKGTVRQPLGWDTYYFTNSNRNHWNRSLSKEDNQLSPYQTNDMAVTGYQMLRWYNECEKDQRLVDYCKRFADKLLTYQDVDGFFPTFIDVKTQKVIDMLKQSPTTALPSIFLIELYKVDKQKKYLQAALKSLDAMMVNVIPNGQWEDYETYWSCSSWGKEFIDKKIPRNNQYKQNTLSMYWAADALLKAYEITKNEKYINVGERVLNELNMYQAVWQPNYMYVDVVGGYGVMNADGEWIDARQSIIGNLLIQYGKTLKNEQYIKRGKAALVAAFSMMYCPENVSKEQWEKVYPFFNEKDYGFMMENYGHNGYTSPDGEGVGVFTIYDWGNGLAAAAYNDVVSKYGMDFFEKH
ncbi:hypothetical protein EMN47_15810 [Prolixibacteraceae bacterium JC049]|nr:hypothetical protein [Prolixibacteraceae bacterium JC049]